MSVEIIGLRETIRALNQAEKGLGRAVQNELRAVAAKVAGTAKEIAEQRGLRGDPGTDKGRGHPGLLISSIRPGVRGSTAYVRDSATRVSAKYPDGYVYPAVYEYGGRGQTAHGPRAFLQPAVERDEPEVLAMLENALGRLHEEAGLSPA